MYLRSKEPFILQDRILLSALLFGSSGYIVIGSWEGVALLVAGFILGTIWAFKTASNHPRRGIRLMATLLLVVLGAFMTVYIAAHQGLVQ